jgi:hypothetical protein
MYNYKALYEKQLKENKLIRQKLKNTQFIYKKENNKLKEENKEAEDNLDEEMLKNEKLEVEVKKLKSTIIVKKALINHWKNKYDKSLEA